VSLSYIISIISIIQHVHVNLTMGLPVLSISIDLGFFNAAFMYAGVQVSFTRVQVGFSRFARLINTLQVID